MEIDAFTQKMLERTQARRDLINKKLPILEQSSSKRQREPLAVDNSNNESNTTPIIQAEVGLKRKSSGAENEAFSPKRSSVDAPKDVNKENDLLEVGHTTTVVRGLAALKKKTPDEIAGVLSSTPNSLTVLHDDIKTLPDSPHITHARSRLAALASNINEWEDDVTDPSKIPSQRFTHDIIKTEVISKQLPPTSAVMKSPEKITKLDACNKKVESPMKTEVVVRVPEVKSQREQVLKPAIEKQEAQGFTKSASASRLMYDYERNADSSIKDRMKIFQQQNTPSSSMKASTLPKKLNPSAIFGAQKGATPVISVTKAPELPKMPFSIAKKVDILSSPKKIQPSSSSSTLAPPSKSLVSSTPVNVDPANLPLSARRAMFETPVHQSNCETPELLTVSQRAALFEKAMNFSPKEGNSPKSNFTTPSLSKMTSQSAINPSSVENTPIFQASVNLGILKNGNGAKDNTDDILEKKIVHFSPSKSVEPHTSQLQQHLLEKVNQTKTNDIASKMIEERKKELEELKNRWNKSPKKPFNPFGTTEKDSSGTDSDDLPSQDPSINESDPSEDDNSLPPPPPPPLPFTSARFNESDGTKHMSPQTSFTTQTKLVCEKFDEMLDEVAKEFSSESESDVEEGSPPRIYPSLKKLKKLENSPIKVNISPTKVYISPTKSIRYEEDKKEASNVHYVEESDDENVEQTTLSPSGLYPSLPSTSESPTKPLYINPISQESESPVLCHSISLYRRQNQNLSAHLTPVKVVKRNVEIDLSPAYKEDREYFEEVQDRIKQLLEDLHRQDVQVKQACQALFLCAAKPEFFGSTEHVEGERLLLITTHKRNACKNTIEQLKTEAALGFNPSGERGTLSISEIRLPLKQEFLAAQMGGHLNDTIHYFFCLIRHREKVIATEMLNTKDGITAGTFSFSNHICLQDLRSNFAVLFEVYALQTNTQNVPHDRKYNIRKDHSKIKITPKSKKLESKARASPALSNIESRERNSNFDIVGSIRLNIDNCRRRISSLEKVPVQSPLEGRVSMKLKLCTEQPIKEKGFLTMFEDVSGFGNWYRRWFVLAGNFISYWKYPDNEKNEAPMGTIDLRQCITPEVGLINPNICVRKHTFSLLSVRPKTKKDQDTLVSQSHNTYTTTEHRLSADTKEERILWCTRLNQALDIIRKWDPEALRPIDINESRA